MQAGDAGELRKCLRELAKDRGIWWYGRLTCDPTLDRRGPLGIGAAQGASLSIQHSSHFVLNLILNG